ncbi:Centromere protein Chl4/mis15/CENP-N [Ceraceosorus bombacis]|uniref:Centromere protein Chl4/mis15/CENP-N n=1 Tax=Ceraceosorus bombacis TaxID=401625 RepID=A0A0P1B826_9BASI|nr:Centromere protein Chl4/mis15/CENP-N [Ceraceosorus bombacis]
MAITTDLLGASTIPGSSATGPNSIHTLQSVPSSTLLAPTPALRRLLTILPKASVCSLVSRWLSSLSSSGRSTDRDITPPSFSRRNAGASTGTSTSTYLDLHESRRARNVEELRALWKGPMLDGRVPKSRAVDRIMETDWPEGISYAMASMISAEALQVSPTSRTWTAARAFFDDGDATPSSLRGISPQAMQARLTSELRNYFTHHLYLLQTPGTSITSSFIHLHLTLPPHAPDMCGGTHILYVPGTRWVLLSGSLGRTGGGNSRSILHAALAQALGALEVRGPKSAVAGRSSTKGGRDENDSEEKVDKTLPELKGKDPRALLDVLLAGEAEGAGVSATKSDAGFGNASARPGAEGGAGRAMRHGQAEDEPLLGANKRKRLLNALSADAQLQESSPADFNATGMAEHPAVRAARLSLQRTVETNRQKEIRELFGERMGKGNKDVPSIERIDYELHLPTPAEGPYRSVSLVGPGAEPIRLRIQGTHILAGMRALVQSGADDKSANAKDGKRSEEEAGAARRDRKGLPTWLTDVRGTRVVVRPVKKAAEGEDSLEA